MQSILASLDSCNQASLFCNSQLTEQISQNQPIDILKKRIQGGKPLNSTKDEPLPLPQTGSVNLSNVLTVFPRSSNCLLLSCGGQSFHLLESAHPASWYSFLNGQGLWRMNINPGQVYSFNHLLIDSSMQLIQLGTKFVAMFMFHSSSISCTSGNLSLYVGGLSFVYFIF